MHPDELPIRHLRLDPDNPRVPESVERSPSGLLHYMYEHGALEELANSFLDNGYFTAEALIVRKVGEDEWVVVEGNRRLATLMILHEVPESEGLHISEPATETQLARLDPVPVMVLEEDDHVDQYLAYRHIGGLKTWSPEAKARFVKRLVARAVADRSDNVFRTVGRQVGSNATGVRNPFLALAVLEHGRDELETDTSHVQYERFGVWIRCMNSADIRSFISLGAPKTYEEVLAAVADVDADALAEVIGDLSPRGTRRPVLQDSRDVTDYGRVLVNERAHRALREHDDLAIARRVIQQQSFPDRIARVASEVELLVDEVNQVDELEGGAPGDQTTREASRLFGAARTLRAAIRDLLGEA